jgi:hypothetical protein
MLPIPWLPQKLCKVHIYGYICHANMKRLSEMKMHENPNICQWHVKMKSKPCNSEMKMHDNPNGCQHHVKMKSKPCNKTCVKLNALLNSQTVNAHGNQRLILLLSNINPEWEDVTILDSSDARSSYSHV